uniref:Uncharacterized protein n=1 Tax=Ornithorhynchus anatinus TaxID=9258 RepID=A0A6I8N203_ORNAN
MGSGGNRDTRGDGEVETSKGAGEQRDEKGRGSGDKGAGEAERREGAGEKRQGGGRGPSHGRGSGSRASHHHEKPGLQCFHFHPSGRRCRCKFNQQQRTGEPDEEEGAFRSSIRRELGDRRYGGHHTA